MPSVTGTQVHTSIIHECTCVPATRLSNALFSRLVLNVVMEMAVFNTKKNIDLS